VIYSTCSYSKEEDEDIFDWLVNTLPVAHCPLLIDKNWSITASENGYRFWPDKVKGEGFFIACFKKTEGEEKVEVKVRSKAEMVTKKEMEFIGKWMKTGDHQLIKKENTVYAWPGSLMNDMNFILSNLKVIYSGVRIGELMRDKLIPDHALAMSNLLNNSVQGVELNYEQIIRYLQRKDLTLDTAQKGWQLVSYGGHPLGWIKSLSNRINNYYPKELRILKDTNE
jgi:NOL1/NOP2/fmu family ribosome biogenesis protein